MPASLGERLRQRREDQGIALRTIADETKIKLSLLERQRAQTLNLEADDAHDGHVARSLEQFRDGLAALRREKEDGDEAYVLPSVK